VLEGGIKPESTLVFEAATSPVRKIAHWIPVTEEMLDDYAQTQSVVDERLRIGLALAEEDQLLNGSGIAPDLLGFNNLTGLAPDVPQGADTPIDAVLKQMMAIATTSYLMPDGFVMNPADWQPVILLKDSTGRYIGSGPFTTAQSPMLWGITGVVTPSQAAGIALIGAFRQAAQLFRKNGVSVEASNSHADFFIKNLVAIRAEERLALAVYREGAFGQVTGLNPAIVP
jgi:HK97 family phage major capsid protein